MFSAVRRDALYEEIIKLRFSITIILASLQYLISLQSIYVVYLFHWYFFQYIHVEIYIIGWYSKIIQRGQYQIYAIDLRRGRL